MSEDVRTHIHKNDTRYVFHHETWAPIPVSKGGSGKVRFAVEPTVYVTGVGWEAIDIATAGAPFLIAMYNYVRTIETLYGYEHVGNTHEQIRTLLENIWGKKEADWNG